MDQYQLKPKDIKAKQWWKLGDHPDVEPYSHPDVEPDKGCPDCIRNFEAHGQITPDGEMLTVCPGDFIVVSGGETSVNDAGYFEETYELVSQVIPEEKPVADKPDKEEEAPTLLSRGPSRADPEALPLDQQTG